MRTLVASLVLVFALGGATEARKNRKAPKRSRLAATQYETPSDWKPKRPTAAEEAAKADAQISDLKSTREIPVTTLNNQDDDREVPRR